MKANDYNTGKMPVWCPGCGNFAIWNAIKGALADCEIEPHQHMHFSGIGCSGKMVNHVKAYGFQGLHGRALPVAMGARLANHELSITVNGGDGDGYGMGMGHFIHAVRRNMNITYIVHHNRTYGLTTGQAAPTTSRGVKTKSTPHGLLEERVNPLALALSAGITFLGRGYSGNLQLTRQVIAAAIQHKGFALVDILQPCVTFARDFIFDYYDDKVYSLEEKGHNASDRDAAYKIAFEEEKYALGIIYQTDKPTYESGLPQLSGAPLAQPGLKKRDVSGLVSALK